MRRRNAGEKGALEIEATRLRLKRFWHSIENAASYRMERRGAAAAPVLKELFGGAPLATHLLGDAFADKGTWAGVETLFRGDGAPKVLFRDGYLGGGTGNALPDPVGGYKPPEQDIASV